MKHKMKTNPKNLPETFEKKIWSEKQVWKIIRKKII